jgi:hypothetical protein
VRLSPEPWRETEFGERGGPPGRPTTLNKTRPLGGFKFFEIFFQKCETQNAQYDLGARCVLLVQVETTKPSLLEKAQQVGVEAQKSDSAVAALSRLQASLRRYSPTQ